MGAFSPIGRRTDIATYVVAQVNGATVGAAHPSASARGNTAVRGAQGEQAVDGVGTLRVVSLNSDSVVAVPVALDDR